VIGCAEEVDGVSAPETRGPLRVRRAPARALRLLALCALVAGCAKPFEPVPDPLRVRAGSIDAAALTATLAEVPRPVPERIERMRQLFLQAGCGSEYLELVMPGGTPYPNVICTLPGRSRWTIVVGAHVDRADDGNGVVDNWTGAALLPHLYRSLAVQEREHSFVFIGFGHVTLDQQGSRGYLRRLGKTRREHIRAMVSLKGLGLGPTSMWSSQADRNLRQDLHSVAKALGLPLESTRFYENVNTDSSSFAWWGIPVITIHSFDQKSARLLHQPYRDRDVSLVDPAAYYDSARLVALYLAYLDDTLRLRDERRDEPVPEAS
jgi:hypothetical protein